MIKISAFYEKISFQKQTEKRFSYIKISGLVLMLICFTSAAAQIKINAEALVSPASRTITINQEVFYTNLTKDNLQEIYLNDWNNAFKDKNSPLGKHFSAVYIKKFHYTEIFNRGETRVDFIKNNHQNIPWNRPEGNPDIIKINLPEKLLPGETTTFQLQYTLRIPENTLTGYGADIFGNFNLKYWLIIPAVYDKKWHIYNHKNLDDEFFPLSDLQIKLKTPPEYEVYSGMKQTPLKGEPHY